MSELTKICENYIVYLQKNDNGIIEKMQLLRFYYERNLDKYFTSTAREIRQMINNMPLGTTHGFYNYQFEELLTCFEIKKYERSANYQNVFFVLNEFMETEKLRWENLSLINLFPSLYKVESKGTFYLLHAQLNKLLKENNDDFFADILILLKTEINKISKEESREILMILFDYSIRKVNSGNYNFYTELYKIYHLFIDRNILLNASNLITVATYKNYITVVLKLGKINEAEIFLEKYKPYLSDENREEIYKFNKSNILFEKKEYDEVLNLIANAKFSDIFYNLNQRRLLIKTYYELFLIDESYHELFISSLNSFKKFIYLKDSIPEIYIEANKNFYKFTQRLSDYVYGDKVKIRKIITSLQKTEKLAEREWLENKLTLIL